MIGNSSETYDFSGLAYLPEDWLGDVDEDGLFDIYEKVIDSDPLDSDTDDDGLPDGYEVLILGTDPRETDTDENGRTDPDEDFDTDHLCNLDEYRNETQPFNPDTDEDVSIDHYNTVFVIDTSGSMQDNPEDQRPGYDPIVRVLRDDAPARPPIVDAAMEAYWLSHYGINTCKRITACENVIDKMHTDDQAAIITFSYGNSTGYIWPLEIRNIIPLS